MDLTDRDRRALELAGTRFRYPAVRAEMALRELGYTESAFWARVNWLVDQAEVEREYPMLCRRLKRLREARRTERTRVGHPMGQPANR